MISDALVALACETPFKLAFKRLRHIRNGHGSDLTYIDKMVTDAHPHSDADWVFTVNLVACNECGLVFLDSGVERRRYKECGE